MFPPETWTHRSSWADAGFAIVNKLTFPFVMAPIGIGGVALGNKLVTTLAPYLGPPPGRWWLASLVVGSPLHLDLLDAARRLPHLLRAHGAA
jgi:hypothetical protein